MFPFFSDGVVSCCDKAPHVDPVDLVDSIDPSNNVREKRYFYGRRCGRPLSNKQQTLLAQWQPEVFITPNHRIDSPSQVLHAIEKACLPSDNDSDNDSDSNNQGEVILEIGPGKGEHVRYVLADNPRNRVLAVEPYVHGAQMMVCHLAQDPNPAALCARLKVATVPLQTLLPMMQNIRFDRIYALFPDPWPRGKHHRRRVINHENMNILSQMLKENGLFMTASDDPSCIDHLADVADACKSMVWVNRDDRFTPYENGLDTRYAQKAKRAGRDCVYIACQRMGS